MRVNNRVFTERIDMLDGIRVPNCPSQFKVIAENIMNMASKPGYSVGDYHTMTELDKMLMVNYWGIYDGLEEIIGRDGLSFHNWFVHKATAPELIRRARQWLSEHNYLILKPEVAERAYQAGDKFSKSIKA
ncbi:MAG: hypothetical protein PHQ86_04725 [Dehalococcoidales bacterium]|nr:hypothetical protein [Dehalococcoidales bacterium]